MQFSRRVAYHHRIQRSGLVTPFDDPLEAAHRLVGVQAQILPAAGLALNARSPLESEAALHAALSEERSLLKLWTQRHTLHLIPSREWPHFHAALAQRRTWWERQVAKRGGDVDAYRALIQRVATFLESRGTLSREELRESDLGLEDRHLSSWGGLFADLVRRGLACHAGPSKRFAARTHWLPDLSWDLPESDAANRDLIRRYLATYGPATLHDIAYWRGARVRDTRRHVEAMADEIVEIRVDDDPALLLQRDLEVLAATRPRVTPARLLYRFDPLLLAHRDKLWLVDEAHHKTVWQKAGHIEPVLFVRGRIAGVWRYSRRANHLDITLRPFHPIAKTHKRALEREARRVARFLDRAIGRLEWAS